jgi:hypothetical protein
MLARMYYSARTAVLVSADPVDAAGQEARTGAADEERDDSDDRFVPSNLRIVPSEPDSATDRTVSASGSPMQGTARRDTDSHGTETRERAVAIQSALDRPLDDLRYQVLLRPITALTAEFGDLAPVRSNVTRAHHLLVRSGLSCDAFLHLVAEARTITLARRGRITKRCVGADNVMRTNMMPYWFSVLTSLVERQAAQQLSDTPAIADAQEPQERQPSSRSQAPSRVDAGPSDEERAGAEQQDTCVQAYPGQRYSIQDTPDHHTLWQHLLTDLQRILAPAVYARALAGVVRSEHGAVLQIEAPDPMHLCWFETRLRRAIEAALAELGEAGLRIEFRLPPTPTRSR